MVKVIYNKAAGKVELIWEVYRGSSEMMEDFRGAKVWVFVEREGTATKCGDRLVVASAVEDGAIRASIPNTLGVGVYSLKAIWTKDAEWKRCESEVKNAFCVTDVATEADKTVGDALLMKVKTTVATYGYDGLDAYEIMCMRHGNMMLESEWLANIGRVMIDTTNGWLIYGEHYYKLTEVEISQAPQRDPSALGGGSSRSLTIELEDEAEDIYELLEENFDDVNDYKGVDEDENEYSLDVHRIDDGYEISYDTADRRNVVKVTCVSGVYDKEETYTSYIQA